MPPELARITGRAQVIRFFATVPADGRLDTIRLVRARANGHPALAAYLPGKSSRCQGYGIMVFTMAGDGIATITGFPARTSSLGSAFPPHATDAHLSPEPGGRAVEKSSSHLRSHRPETDESREEFCLVGAAGIEPATPRL
jgi:hypothetical protein